MAETVLSRLARLARGGGGQMPHALYIWPHEVPLLASDLLLMESPFKTEVRTMDEAQDSIEDGGCEVMGVPMKVIEMNKTHV